MSSAAVPVVFPDVASLDVHLRRLGTLPSADDPVMTELDHALQTAGLLADAYPADRALWVAGLVHDVAHPWDGPGQPRHAVLGAAAIRPLLGDRVAWLVGAHVEAKRWLVACDPTYVEVLSADSRQTLDAQGGALGPAGVRRFEAHAWWRDAVALRRADDAAKVPGRPTRELDEWMDVVAAVAAQPQARSGGTSER